MNKFLAQEEIIKISEMCFPEEKIDEQKEQRTKRPVHEIQERTKIAISMFLNTTTKRENKFIIEYIEDTNFEGFEGTNILERLINHEKNSIEFDDQRSRNIEERLDGKEKRRSRKSLLKIYIQNLRAHFNKKQSV